VAIQARASPSVGNTPPYVKFGVSFGQSSHGMQNGTTGSSHPPLQQSSPDGQSSLVSQGVAHGSSWHTPSQQYCPSEQEEIQSPSTQSEHPSQGGSQGGSHGSAWQVPSQQNSSGWQVDSQLPDTHSEHPVHVGSQGGSQAPSTHTWPDGQQVSPQHCLGDLQQVWEPTGPQHTPGWLAFSQQHGQQPIGVSLWSSGHRPAKRKPGALAGILAG
jgi:hypothetical protein